MQIINKRERKPRWQSSIVNPERFVTLGTQDTERIQQQEIKGEIHMHKVKKMSNKDPIKNGINHVLGN